MGAFNNEKAKAGAGPPPITVKFRVPVGSSITLLRCYIIVNVTGAAIALFNLSQHDPTETTHQTVLQCVVFQVTACSLLQCCVLLVYCSYSCSYAVLCHLQRNVVQK